MPYFFKIANFPVLILLLFLFISFPGLASPKALKRFEVYEMSIEELMDIEVVTATKSSQKISDSPANIIVVTKEQIRERGYVNLLDLLADLPGVDVQNKSTEEFFNQITFRGSVENSRFIIMMDGHRINSPTNENIPISDNFPLYNARQVEIVFGPGSALYGADAFVGIVNIITEDPEEIDGMQFSSSIGQYGYYYDYLNFGKKLARNVDFAFGGHWNNSNNQDLSRHYPKEFGKTDLVTFSGETVLRAEDRKKYNFETSSYSTYAKLDIDDYFTFGFSQSYFNHPSSNGTRPERDAYNKDARWETLIRNYYGEYKFGVADNLSGKSTISYLTYEVLPDSRYENIFVDFNKGYKYAKSKRFMLEQQINFRINDTHTLVGGVSWEDFYSLPKTADLNRPYDRNLPASLQDFTYQGTDNSIPLKIYELNYENTAGYIQAQSQWSDIFSSTIGVRYDYNTRYGKTVNPRAGLILKPWEKTTLKILYGESHLTPSTYTAYSHYGTFNGTKNSEGEYISDFFHLPNPDLKPEKSRTPEFIISQQFTRNLNITLTAYYTWIENTIHDAFYGASTDYIKGGEILAWKRYENLGNSEIYGGDLRINYQMNLDPVNLKFWGNYTFVDGWEEDGSGAEVELKYIANHKLKGGLTATYAKKYFITPMIRWIGETNHQSIDPDHAVKRQKVDSYTLVNLHCGVNNFWNNFSATMNIRNLFDNRHYNAGGGSSSFVSSPQDTRRIIGTLEYKFH